MQPRPPLEGIKVLDLTQAAAGPMAAALLSQWGAEVIHVEQPGRGDQCRTIPFPGYNFLFEQVNVNKRGLTADLNQPEGRDIIYRLIGKSDVLVSNLRPYEIDKFELGFDKLKEINPRIIHANLTGFGMQGLEKDLPGIDQTAYFARSGITYMISPPGQEPVRSRPIQGDMPVALSLTCGIMMALFAREKLGVGQAVHTSLFNCGVWNISVDILRALVTSEDQNVSNEQMAFNNPLNSFYMTKDQRWILLSRTMRAPVEPDPFWESVCRALKLEHVQNDPCFCTEKKRVENMAALCNILGGAFAQRDLEEWRKCLTEFGIRFTVVHKPVEIVNDHQARVNGFFHAMNHPLYGPIELLKAPFSLTETPGAIRTPAPRLGQHTQEILVELGYSPDEIKRLREKEAV